MKEAWILSVALFIGGAVTGQTFSEWFRQKKTQIQYLKDQIVALKAYQDMLEKGYEIATKGLDDIGSIKEADWNMHADHFGSLKEPKGAIRDDPRVQATRNLLAKIVENANVFSETVFAVENPSADLVAWALKTRNDATDIDIGSRFLLDDIVNGSDVSMQDDERLVILDQLYRGVQLMYRNSIHIMQDLRITLNERP
jgi:hypothetical protein